MRALLDGKVVKFAKVQALFVSLALCSCNSDIGSTDRRLGVLQLPSRADFNRVSDAMQLRCGTLDCHGQTSRNLRLYGRYGLRLDPADDPSGNRSTPMEYDASFWSIVSLEPETMSRVVDKELEPEQLSLVRKARGVEKHKGDKLMTAGDVLDRCLVGWVTGALDLMACTTVVRTPPPTPDGGR